MIHFKKTNLVFVATLFIVTGFLTSCGKAKTEKLIMNKRWEVYDVTPPPGLFSVEKSKRAKQLKNGFYKNAWFEFLPDSMFVASFGGKIDTAKYVIRFGGDAISLYPRYGDKIYEQIEIVKLTDEKLKFNTEVADFNMTLHLKAVPLK